MIRVFIADDHAIFRLGLRQLLAGYPDLSIVGEAADGHAALHGLEQTPADVLLLDLSLPTLNGTEVLRRLQERPDAPAVVVLSMYAEEQFRPQVMKAGAKDYVSKQAPPNELVASIRAAAGFGTAPRPASPADTTPPHHTLSAREYQVFTLLFEGRSVTDIAAELNLGQSTVSGYLANVRKKLNCRTVAEIVSYAHRVGLVK